MAWLPLQSYAGMSDAGKSADASMVPAAVHCHGSMTSDSADGISDTANKLSQNCCCDGCDSSCDSGCMHGGNMAVLSSDNRVSADKHHAFQVSTPDHLNGLTYSPPLPPPLV